MKIFYPVLILLVIACNNTPSKPPVPQQLLGTWHDTLMGKKSFIKFGDSAYFSFYGRSFAYDVVNDSLYIHFGDNEYRGKYVIKGDTLFTFSPNGKDISWR